MVASTRKPCKNGMLSSPFSNFNDQVQGATEMFDRLDMLEEVLTKFFSSMRITKKMDGVEVEDYPKKTYLEAIKSHLKMHNFNVSVCAVDISNDAMFPKLAKMMKGLKRHLKKAGWGEVTHNKKIPQDSLMKIFHLFFTVTKTVLSRIAVWKRIGLPL